MGLRGSLWLSSLTRYTVKALEGPRWTQNRALASCAWHRGRIGEVFTDRLNHQLPWFGPGRCRRNPGEEEAREGSDGECGSVSCSHRCLTTLWLQAQS